MRTLNFPVKSRLFRYLSDLRCMREFEKRRNFHSTTTEDGTLHAGVLGFIHPRTGEYMEFTAPLPEYFAKLLNTLPE